MTCACAEIWAIAMTKNYCSYLGGAVEGVEKLLDSTCKAFEGSYLAFQFMHPYVHLIVYCITLLARY